MPLVDSATVNPTLMWASAVYVALASCALVAVAVQVIYAPDRDNGGWWAYVLVLSVIGGAIASLTGILI